MPHRSQVLPERGTVVDEYALSGRAEAIAQMAPLADRVIGDHLLWDELVRITQGLFRHCGWVVAAQSTEGRNALDAAFVFHRPRSTADAAEVKVVGSGEWIAVRLRGVAGQRYGLNRKLPDGTMGAWFSETEASAALLDAIATLSYERNVTDLAARMHDSLGADVFSRWLDVFPQMLQYETAQAEGLTTLVGLGAFPEFAALLDGRRVLLEATRDDLAEKAAR